MAKAAAEPRSSRPAPAPEQHATTVIVGFQRQQRRRPAELALEYLQDPAAAERRRRR
jgi:hypothetical protein